MSQDRSSQEGGDGRAPRGPSGLDEESRGYEPLDFTTPSRRDWASSVWWLFVPVLLLLGFSMWQRTAPHLRSRGYGEPEAPPELDRPVDGWSTQVEVAGGSIDLRLRLEPLHPTEARQAFDAAALGARFRGGGANALPGAQPWRLSLAAVAKRTTPAEAVAVDDLSGVRIVGLEPLVPVFDTPSDGTIVDPLAALFSFPLVPLRAGESIDLVFWGMRPADEVAVTAPGIADPVVLRRRERASSSGSSSIARLDARAQSLPEEGR